MAKTMDLRDAGLREPGPGPRGWHRHRLWHRLRLTALALMALLSLFLAAAAGYGIGFVRWAEAEFDRGAYAPGELDRIPGPEAGAPICQPTCTYLILGSDSRAGLPPEEQVESGSEETVPGQRADTIILVHIDPARERAVIVHFPRDLWVPIVDDDPTTPSEWKINSAFEGGANVVVGTVEELTGMEIDHYVEVNLAGFERTVDALGGVPICVDRPMFDARSHLDLPRAGCYDMDGRTALAFVRARHIEDDCGPIPDFNRIARQQQFLRSVMRRLLSPSVFANIGGLVRSVAGNLPHDPYLNLTDLLELANRLKGIETGSVDFRAVPSLPGTTDLGASVLYLEPEAELLFKRLRNGKPLGAIGKELVLTPPSPANVAVRVVNASSGGVASNVQSFLSNAGFEVIGEAPSNEVPDGVEGPVILYDDGKEAQAKTVQAFLSGLEIVEANLGVADVAVVITAGYTGPGSGAGGGGSGSGNPAPTQPPEAGPACG